MKNVKSIMINVHVLKYKKILIGQSILQGYRLAMTLLQD